jgi:hypothetical protein
VGVLSTESAHEVVAEEAEMEVVLGGRETPPLELTGVQNLESEQPEVEGVIDGVTGGDTIVARNPIFEPIPAVPQGAFDTLEAMMKESKMATAVVIEATLKESASAPDRLGYADITEVTMKALAEAREGKPSDDINKTPSFGDEFFAAGYSQSKAAARAFTFLGELPNGDYRATVRISETYVEGCKQQAEADGISLEDWLTGHLHSYLENWWAMPGSK